VPVVCDNHLLLLRRAELVEGKLQYRNVPNTLFKAVLESRVKTFCYHENQWHAEHMHYLCTDIYVNYCQLSVRSKSLASRLRLSK
jgi:hypothetical protein